MYIKNGKKSASMITVVKLSSQNAADRESIPKVPRMLGLFQFPFHRNNSGQFVVNAVTTHGQHIVSCGLQLRVYHPAAAHTHTAQSVCSFLTAHQHKKAI